nr:hypothetical protein [Tanacetum cinerariifolium]
MSQADVNVDNFKRCCTSYTFLVEYRVLKDFILHRSLINNNARLSYKFERLYFIFKFGILGLLHHVVTTIAARLRESAQDMNVGLGGSWFRNFAKKESMKKFFQDILHGLEEVNPTHAYYNGSRTNKDNEDPSWSTSFKTKRTQKTSLALKCFGRLYFVVIVLDRNIGTRKSQPFPKGKMTDPKDSKGNKHPVDMGLPATILDKSIGKTKPLPEGPREDRDSERLKPFA